MIKLRTKLEKLFAHKDDKIIEVINIINQNLLKTAFVVDENNKLLGVVSDGDIRRAILKDISLIKPVETIITKNPLVARIGTSESEILGILLEKNLQIIPILNNRKMVVSYYHLTDFIKEEFLKEDVMKSIDLEQSKKILITGGAGYLGSTVVRMLLEKGYSVRVLDKLMFGKESVIDLMDNPNFELVKGDYTKIDELIPCLNNIFAVIHFAAIVGDPAGNIDPDLTRDINFHGVKILAEFCKYYGIDRFIFISTCSVYGASNNEILREESDLNPVSLYAETKLKAEKVLLKAKDKNFHPCILRLATAFGWSYRMRFDLVLNLLTALSVRKKEISIFFGKQWRPFIHVRDVGRAIFNVLGQPIERISGRCFNIGKEENNYQIGEIGKLMKKIFPEIKVNIVEKNEDDRSYRVSYEKARETLNFTAIIGLEEGIKEIAQHLNDEKINIEDRKYSNYKKVSIGTINSIYFFE